MSRRHVKALAAVSATFLAIGLLLLAPGLIDWTEYRATFAQRLGAATGRTVSIDGTVDFVLLPRPALNADAVRMGGTGGDFIAVERLSARLALLPLLKGELAFRELVLRRPEARITRNAAGAVEFLNFNLAQSPKAGVGTTPPPAPIHLDVDRVLIDEGVVTYEDAANGTIITARGIDVVLVAPPQSPVTLKGDVTLGSVPLTVDAMLGRAGSSGTRSLTLAVQIPEADAAGKFSGALASSKDAWEIRGDVSISGPTGSGLLGALGIVDGTVQMPQALQKPFSLSTRIRGNTAALAIDPVSLDVGGTTAKGSIAWRQGEAGAATMDVKLELGAVQLENWQTATLAPLVLPPFAIVSSAYAQSASPTQSSAVTPFRNIGATFDLRAPVLSYRGQTLSGGVVTAALGQGVLTISQATIDLPAATRVSAVGRVRLSDGAQFEGTVEAQTGDLRNMMAWLGWGPAEVMPLPGRLSNASLRARLSGTPAHFTMDDLSAVVDTSTITGQLTWGRTASNAGRPTWAADVVVNTLNIDAYMPMFRQAPAPQTVAVPVSPPPAAAAGYGVTPIFATFASLADFDAEVRLQIDSMTYGGIANGKAGIDASLNDGTLFIRSASFENIGGATAWFGGGIAGFGVTPRFDDLQFDLSATDLGRVARAFQIELPAPLKALSPVSITGVLKGSLAQADVAATLKAANLTVQADAQALTLDQQPHITMNVQAADPSYAALVRAAGEIWPIGMADPGAVKLSARIVHDRTETKIETLALRIGANALAGDLRISRTQPVPEVKGTLTGVTLAVDRLLPQRAAATRVIALTPARAGGGSSAAQKSVPWSSQPFDWSFLSGWSGEVHVSGASLAMRGIQVQDFSGNLNVANDSFELTEWNGKIFGAPGQLYLRAASAPLPMIQGEIAFLGGDLGAVANAINGAPGPLKSSGKADFAGSFRAEGATPAALAASISGSGTVKITATEAGSGPIAGVLGAITAANQVEGAMKGGPVTLESRFSAADGRVKVEDATVASKSYGGAFGGIIDLGAWLVDLSGRLRLESRAAADAGKPQVVPITVKGALDLPNIRLLPAS